MMYGCRAHGIPIGMRQLPQLFSATRGGRTQHQKVERFRDVFGHMTITYSKGTMTSDYRGEVGSFPYRALESGSNFVVIRCDAPLDKDRNIRTRFADGDSSYWIDTGPLGNGNEDRFDRVKK